MDIRQITPRYHVSPQIAPEDIATLPELGFTTLVCNRPDAENPPELAAEVMRQKAEAAGLEFHNLPLTHATMTPENLTVQRGFIESAAGKVLAYCASGTRCTVAWALAHANDMSAEDILQTAHKGGYDLSGLRPALDAAAG